MVKKRKLGKGNLHLTKNRLVETKRGMRQKITIICVTLCAKGFLDSNFDEVVIDKIIKFSRNDPKFHIFTNIAIFCLI